ncbi:MAG: ABC transporter substrate-binding protein [Tetrasphaera sp.]|nr:ABC transporter substrate-binding protein [Tetrasphaera sp.]
MPPADPAVRALIRAARASRFSRRSLMSTAAVGASAAALSACAPPKPPSGGVAALKLPTDVSATDKVVRWANWTAYLDQDENGQHYPTLEAFAKKTGIQATYSEDVDDNDSYVSKVKPQLQAGQDIQKDIFTLTDWMANRMIREQLVQPLQLINMPNVVANLRPSLKFVSFDPGRNNSVTWQSGFAGIGYDRSKVGKDLKSLDDLFTPELKGKVTVLSEFRDTLGLFMQWNGIDIAGDWTKTQFDQALEKFTKLLSDDYIRRVKGNAYLNDLKTGNASPFIFPSEDYIAQHKIQGFRALSPQDDNDYSAAWARAVGN